MGAGQRYGNLTVISGQTYMGNYSAQRFTLVDVLCDCGRTVAIPVRALTNPPHGYPRRTCGYRCPFRSNAWPSADVLSERRLYWALLRPGEPSPYACTADGCPKLADPDHRYLCAMHYRRWWLTGKLDRDGCACCGQELDGWMRYICHGCASRGVRYCASKQHEGARLLTVSQMRDKGSGYPPALCKACCNARRRERSRARGVPPAPSRPPCGTPGGYHAHYYRGEAACEPCREAWRVNGREAYRRRKGLSGPGRERPKGRGPRRNFAPPDG